MTEVADVAATPDVSRSAPPWTITAIVSAAAVVLILTASTQIFDATFYAMGNAESLLSGDGIYREFFEPGVPAASYTAAAAQILSGHRLIGEFIRQWLFILAAFAVAAHLGLRLSRSAAAVAAMMSIALLILAVTPIYHHDKLFFFPLMVWACWRYIDRPSVQRAAITGCVTAVAFLFRHDYGVYLGIGSVGAFVLARVAVPEAREMRATIHDAVAYVGAVLIVLSPWLVAVETREGLVAYARSRADLFEGTPGIAYASLLHINPIRTFKGDAIVWVQQMALLVPIALCLTGLRHIWRAEHPTNPGWHEGCRLLFAGGFLAVIDVALLRQPSYVVVIAPVTAALSARLLVSPSPAVRASVGALAALTLIAALSWMKGNPLYDVYKPSQLSWSVQKTFGRLIAYPPDYEYLPFEYLRECTAPGDHILITGLTPPHVSYYAQRPMAGGHLRWRRGWRSDPAHEAQSLALLQRQSVPIAFSTADPVLDTFTSYPHIRAYLEKYYAPVAGTKGFIIVDTRRRPTGTFGPQKFPCFRADS